jgi:hypothetical protein
LLLAVLGSHTVIFPADVGVRYHLVAEGATDASRMESATMAREVVISAAVTLVDRASVLPVTHRTMLPR